jgi:DNA modification methylase
MSVRILTGDALTTLRTLDAEKYQCCVTSPPYWRQRDYGVAGQLGLELTPEEYVARLIAIFAEVRRVLKDDGTLWLNLGDKWASGGNGGGGSYMADRGEAWAHAKNAKGWRKPPRGYKDKDLVGIPWMTAFALRADGWYLRQCNIWAKPNGMPESVTDRSTISHEYVFHLSKSNDYFYNADAARTPPTPATETRLAQNVDAQEGSARANGGAKTNGKMKAVAKYDSDADLPRHRRRSTDEMIGTSRDNILAGCNLRSVWWVAPAQYREAHFAVMPNRIAELCIVAGSRPGDTVLDPFGGVGTTGLVADRLSRHALLIELNPQSVELARRRITDDAPLFGDCA